jgi:hypothetical protein
MEKYFNKIFALFCIFGCLYQIHEISVIYFKYETRTDVKYENEKIIPLPAITFCSIKSYFIKENIYNKIIKNTTEDKYSHKNLLEALRFLNRMSIKEQFEVLLSSSDLSKMDCLIHKPLGLSHLLQEDDPYGPYLRCNVISVINISISEYRYCFTYFSQFNQQNDNRYEVSYEENSRGIQELISLVHFKRPDFIKYFDIYFHSRNEYINKVTDVNYIRYDNQNIKTDIIYSKTIIRLMPHPYVTACVDYRKIGYYSKDDCIFKCQSKNYVKNYQKWPFYYQSFEINSNLSFNVITDKLNGYESIDCNKFCGFNDDCVKQFYSLSQKIFKTDQKQTGAHVTIPFPNTPNLLITHLPKIQIEEFMCYIGSIASLWFGFSLITFKDFCVLFVEKSNTIYNNYKNKYKISINATNTQLSYRTNKI